MLAQYDSNGDGKLSQIERKQKRQHRIVTRFEKLDSNGDAQISSAEAQAACGPIKHRFTKVDADNSGPSPG